jgi:hypothetical protein
MKRNKSQMKENHCSMALNKANNIQKTAEEGQEKD